MQSGELTNEKMTSRQRIMAVLQGRTPDRVPWVPLTGRFYVSSLPALGLPIEEFAPPELATTPALQERLNLAEIQILRYVSADIMRRHVMAWKTEYNRCTPFERREGETLISGFETPKGSIWEKREFLSGTEYISKHMLETPEDIEAYRAVIADTRVKPFYQDFKEFEEFVGEDGINTLTGPLTPLQELLQFKMGLQNTTFALMDEPERMEALFSDLHKLNLEIYQVMAESPAEVAVNYEDTSTTVLSPDWYRRYCMAELDEYSEILHRGGMYHIAHMCGKISLLTDLIAQNKFDGVDSVCPPTTGDLEPGDALRQIGKTIIGGLEPPALSRMDPDEVVEYTAEKLQQVAAVEGGPANFMLATGDSTAAGTPPDNLRAISEYVKQHPW